MVPLGPVAVPPVAVLTVVAAPASAFWALALPAPTPLSLPPPPPQAATATASGRSIDARTPTARARLTIELVGRMVLSWFRCWPGREDHAVGRPTPGDRPVPLGARPAAVPPHREIA